MIFPAAQEISGRTPWRLNSRTASRARRNCPVKLTSMTFYHWARVISINGASDCKPALLIRISTAPNSLRTASNILKTSASLRNVSLLGESMAAIILDFSYDILGFVRAGDIVDADIRAGGPKRDGDSLANSRTCSGNNGGLTFRRRRTGTCGRWTCGYS